MAAPVQPSTVDRLLTAIRNIIRAELPQFTYHGLYEFTIQETDGTTVNGTPVDTTQNLPPVTNVPMRSSILGEISKPKVGNRCLIQFVNGDPTRPICVSCDPIPDTAGIDAKEELDLGKTATMVSISGGQAPQGAARIGDTAGPYAIITGSSKCFIG